MSSVGIGTGLEPNPRDVSRGEGAIAAAAVSAVPVVQPRVINFRVIKDKVKEEKRSNVEGADRAPIKKPDDKGAQPKGIRPKKEQVVNAQTDPKERKMDKWFNHHVLTDVQRSHIAKIIPIPISDSFTLETHSHPISNAERRRAEFIAHSLLRKVVKSKGMVMDVGGNARRNQSRPDVHCTKPIIEPADVVRRMYDEGNFCAHTAQSCDCHDFVGAMFVHSHYYIGVSDFMQILKKCGGVGVVVCYAFPYFSGRQSFGESRYVVEDGIVCQQSPDRIYKHPTGHYVFDGQVGKVYDGYFQKTVTLCTSVMERVGSTYVILCALHDGVLPLNPISHAFDHTAREFVGEKPFLPGDMQLSNDGVNYPFNKRMYYELMSRVGFKTRDVQLVNSVVCNLYQRWVQMDNFGDQLNMAGFRRLAMVALEDGIENTYPDLYTYQETVKEHNDAVKRFGSLELRETGSNAWMWVVMALVVLVFFAKGAVAMDIEEHSHIYTTSESFFNFASGVTIGIMMLTVGTLFSYYLAFYLPILLVLLYKISPVSAGDGTGYEQTTYFISLIIVMSLFVYLFFKKKKFSSHDWRFRSVGVCREGMFTAPAGEFVVNTPPVPFCRGKLMAVCDSVCLEEKPVFAQNCVHNQRLAVETRLDMLPNPEFDHNVHKFFASVLREYMRVAKLRMENVPTSFVSWVTERSYPNNYIRVLVRAYEGLTGLSVDSFERTKCHNEIFVKREAYAKLDCKPRLISGKTPEFKVLTCPFFQGLTKAWATWTNDTDFRSACGMKAAILGKDVYEATESVGNLDYVFVEIDYTSWESSDTGLLLDVETEFYLDYAKDTDCEYQNNPQLFESAIRSVAKYRGFSKENTEVRGKGIRASGGGETSCGNGMTNISLVLSLILTYYSLGLGFIKQLMDKTEASFVIPKIYCWVNGDDNLLYVPRQFALWILDKGVLLLRQGGFRPKVLLRENYLWGTNAVFCSGRFMWDDDYNPTWVPKLGRILFKSFWKPPHLFPTKENGYFTKMVLQSMVAFSKFPVIRALYARFVLDEVEIDYESAHFKIWNKDNEHKMGSNNEVIMFHVRTAMDYLFEIYGLSEQEILALELFILNIKSLPVVIPAELTRKLFEVDFEPDDSGKVGSFLEEGVPLYANAFN